MKEPYTTNVSGRVDSDPFGMMMEGRSWTVGSEYRYSFNGMEHDDETAGNDVAVDFGARIYDSRLGRWLSVDPMYKSYPSTSAYSGMGNSPILFLDYQGMEIVPVTTSPNWNQANWNSMVTEIQKMDDHNIVKMLWNYYSNSTSIDIYVAANSFEDIGGGFDAYSTFGVTLNDISRVGIEIIDNKLVVDSEKAPYLNWFESFNGVDVSNSDGNEINLIGIEEYFMTLGTNWSVLSSEETMGKIEDLTYLMIHEIAAHLSIFSYSNNPDHKAYGEEQLYQAAAGSIASYINSQLTSYFDGEQLTDEQVQKSSELFKTLTGKDWDDSYNNNSSDKIDE
mgnify:CR=1 FL=1